MSIYLNDIGLTELPVSPKHIHGNFEVVRNKLTSLQGSPEVIEGYFNCSLNHLNDLMGAPKFVRGSFNCNVNDLITLKGGPKKIGRFFECRFFWCRENKLTILIYSPKTCRIMSGNNKLLTLDYIPSI